MARGKKLERGYCQVCGVDVAVYPDGLVVRHKDRETRDEPPYGWCDGSNQESQEMRDMPLVDPNTPVVDLTSNHTVGVTGDYFSFMTDEEKAAMRRKRIMDHPLSQWWMTLAEEDLEALLPKAREYSAYDLIMVGRGLGDMISSDLTAANDYSNGDAAAAEIACWFYILGKVGRAIGAIKEGRLPSLDTADDGRIYFTMIRRIRECGAWPGVDA